MGKITAVYSKRERLAIVLAYDPPRVSAREVAERARAGRLVDGDGRLVDAFACEVASVRTISSRARRSGVLHEHRGEVDLEASKQLYRTLSVRARRRVEAAETEDDIRRATRMLSELRDLEGTLARAPAPSSRGTLAGSILAAHRDGVYTPERVQPDTVSESPVGELPPEPEPAKAPAPKPAPELPHVWMRARLAAFTPEAPAAPKPIRTGLGHGDETVQSRPNPTPRDKPLPKVEPERSRQTIGGMPDYCYPPGSGRE